VVYYGKIKSYKIMPTMPEVGPNWLKKKKVSTLMETTKVVED
jgi:hypothetical protein